MALISALGLAPRAIIPANPRLDAAKRDVVYRSGLSLRDAAVDIAKTLMIELHRVPEEARPKSREQQWAFPIVLNPDFWKLFPSLDDFHMAIYDEYVNPARITINAELAHARLARYKVRSILLDPNKSAFVITLRWVKEPSRFKKLLRRRTHR